MQTTCMTFLGGVIFAIIFACSGCTKGQHNLVKDGDFVNFNKSQPANSQSRTGQWGTGLYSHFGTWWNSHNADTKAESVRLEDGTNCLSITNRSPRTVHVFGTTSQRIKINPNARGYRIYLRARANELTADGNLQILVDAKWNVRPISLPGGSYDWQTFTGDFNPADVDTAAKGYIDLRVLSQGTGRVQITGLEMHEL